MTTQTVMTHALTQGNYMATLAPVDALCWVPTCRTTAIHVMLESMSIVPAGSALCAYHSPFDLGSARVAPAPAGVSLAKATDLPNGVVMITSVGEADYRARMTVDVAHRLTRGQRRGMDRNDLRALARVFGTLARRAA